MLTTLTSRADPIGSWVRFATVRDRYGRGLRGGFRHFFQNPGGSRFEAAGRQRLTQEGPGRGLNFLQLQRRLGKPRHGQEQMRAELPNSEGLQAAPPGQTVRRCRSSAGDQAGAGVVVGRRAR